MLINGFTQYATVNCEKLTDSLEMLMILEVRLFSAKRLTDLI